MPRIPSSQQHKILHALWVAGPLYGREVQRRTGIPDGSVYTQLERCEEQGWIERQEARLIYHDGGPQASTVRPYAITERGKRALQAREAAITILEEGERAET